MQQMMGDHAPVAVEEYEYEGLPPNFTLAENMAAGAFAGIAVNKLATTLNPELG